MYGLINQGLHDLAVQIGGERAVARDQVERGCRHRGIRWDGYISRRHHVSPRRRHQCGDRHFAGGGLARIRQTLDPVHGASRLRRDLRHDGAQPSSVPRQPRHDARQAEPEHAGDEATVVRVRAARRRSDPPRVLVGEGRAGADGGRSPRRPRRDVRRDGVCRANRRSCTGCGSRRVPHPLCRTRRPCNPMVNWLRSPRMDDQRFSLSAALLDVAFPFHLVLDRDLRIIQAGTSIQRLHGDSMVGSAFTALVRGHHAEGWGQLRHVRRSAAVAVPAPVVDEARPACFAAKCCTTRRHSAWSSSGRRGSRRRRRSPRWA